MKTLNYSIMTIIVVGLLLVGCHKTSDSKEGSIGVYGDGKTYLRIHTPSMLKTNWELESHPYLISWGVPIKRTSNNEISPEWLEVLQSLIGCINIETGEVIPLDFRFNSDMPAGWIELVPKKSFLKDQGYKLTIKGTDAQKIFSNISVFANNGDELLTSSSAVPFYTYSRPTVSRVKLFTDNKGTVRAVVTFSEPLRVDDIRNNKRAEFFIDGIPINDCVEPYDDCGYANDQFPGATRSYGVMEIDGVEVSVTSSFDFRLPANRLPVKNLSFKFPKNTIGVQAVIADGAKNDKNAVVDGDAISYRYDLSQLKKITDTNSEWINLGE